MQRLAILALTLLFAALSGGNPLLAQKKAKEKPPTAENIELSGKYDFTRTIVGGKKLEGSAIFTADGDGWLVTYQFDNGKVIKGFAARLNDSVAVSWSEPNEHKDKKETTVLGVTAYKVKVTDAKPSLEGIYVSQNGSGQAFEEKLKFNKALKKE